MEVKGLSWRKSSYSENGGGNCVEVADRSGVILVRDTKDRERGHLTVDTSAWSRFVAEVKAVLPASTRAPVATVTGAVACQVVASRPYRRYAYGISGADSAGKRSRRTAPG